MWLEAHLVKALVPYGRSEDFDFSFPAISQQIPLLPVEDFLSIPLRPYQVHLMHQHEHVRTGTELPARLETVPIIP